MVVDAKEKQYQKKKRLSAVWVLIVWLDACENEGIYNKTDLIISYKCESFCS
jgi:hypothetical protein